MKATEQYFPVVPFIMLYKVVLPFESLDEIVKRDHSNAYSKRQSVLPTTESSAMVTYSFQNFLFHNNTHTDTHPELQSSH